MTEERTFEEKVEELEQSYVPMKLSDLEKEVLEIDRQETYIVDATANHVIKYYPIFDQRKINEIAIELSEKIKYAQENKINFFKDNEEFFTYLDFLIIKKFTHFNNEIKNDLESQIPQLEALIRLGYYDLIMNEVFSPMQISRVVDKVLTYAALAEKINQMEIDGQEKAKRLTQKAKAVQKSKKTTPKKKKK